jgi:hypothetical protein
MVLHAPVIIGGLGILPGFLVNAFDFPIPLPGDEIQFFLFLFQVGNDDFRLRDFGFILLADLGDLQLSVRGQGDHVLAAHILGLFHGQFPGALQLSISLSLLSSGEFP